ncbi:DUF6178 family protein [Haliangium sp.]|uniref:DUF6178 family protein n=1 Tax=Haliangium sp. TaxID=2663208 RepID=UPI003D0A03AD
MSTRADSPPAPLTRLRALLAGPRGRQRLDALLAADDPAAEVAALPATELYQIVADVGLADAVELIALATPEQLRGCLDIDAWDRDRVQIEAVAPWLAALLEAGYEKFAEVWEKLDPELSALTLQRLTRIYDLSLGEEPPEPEGDREDERAIAQTPDSYFAVELPEDPNLAALVHRVLEDLYRADPSGVLARHSLMAARSEPPAELEEMSWRWRAGRMADLGYADFYDALEVFRPIDPDQVSIDEGSAERFDPVDQDSDADERAAGIGHMPVPVAEGVVGTSFLARALDLIDDPDELHRVETALVVLVNKVLAVARVSPGDSELTAAGARHAAATCALGLESLSKGDLVRASEALRTVSLTRLHRLGHTLTVRLARMAQALAPRAVGASERDQALLQALLGRRPWYPAALDGDGGGGEELRPFESMADVRAVAEALTRLALRVAVVDGLGVDLAALAERPEPRPGLDDYLRTALVRAALGQAPAATPLTPAEVAELRRRGFADGALRPAAKAAAQAGLLTVVERVEAGAGRRLVPGLVAEVLADIEERLGGLPIDATPDPRFLPGFVWAE